MDFNTLSHFGPSRQISPDPQPNWFKSEYDNAFQNVQTVKKRRVWRLPLWPGLWLRFELEHKYGQQNVQKV